MNEMTLSSTRRIRNLSPGGLRPSTLPLGQGGTPQYWVLHVDGKETFFVFFQTAETGNRTPNSGVKGSGANHYLFSIWYKRRNKAADESNLVESVQYSSSRCGSFQYLIQKSRLKIYGRGSYTCGYLHQNQFPVLSSLYLFDYCPVTDK